jgi:hypothetical protein
MILQAAGNPDGRCALSMGSSPTGGRCVKRRYTLWVVEGEDLYVGIPVVDLPVTEVDVPDPVHLRRSQQYQGEIDIGPAAAVEAALDPRGLIARDPRSRTGEAVRVVGFIHRREVTRGGAAS